MMSGMPCASSMESEGEVEVVWRVFTSFAKFVIGFGSSCRLKEMGSFDLTTILLQLDS